MQNNKIILRILYFLVLVSGFSFKLQAIVYVQAQQADGKSVSVETNPINNRIQVVRYETNGTIDPNFGTLGAVSLHMLQNFTPTNIQINNNGKILITGSGPLFVGGLGITQISINPNGSRNSNFGTNGILIFDPTQLHS